MYRQVLNDVELKNLNSGPHTYVEYQGLSILNHLPSLVVAIPNSCYGLSMKTSKLQRLFGDELGLKEVLGWEPPHEFCDLTRTKGERTAFPLSLPEGHREQRQLPYTARRL